MADELRRFIEADEIAQDAKLWPRLTRNTANMIKCDLSAARKAWLDEATDDDEQCAQEIESNLLRYEDASGRFADFHASAIRIFR